MIELFRRKTSAKKITEQMSVSRKSLYDWKSKLVGMEFPFTMPIQSSNYEENMLKVEKPNNKWLTDITGFLIPAEKVYL